MKLGHFTGEACFVGLVSVSVIIVERNVGCGAGENILADPKLCGESEALACIFNRLLDIVRDGLVGLLPPL